MVRSAEIPGKLPALRVWKTEHKRLACPTLSPPLLSATPKQIQKLQPRNKRKHLKFLPTTRQYHHHEGRMRMLRYLKLYVLPSNYPTLRPQLDRTFTDRGQATAAPAAHALAAANKSPTSPYNMLSFSSSSILLRSLHLHIR